MCECVGVGVHMCECVSVCVSMWVWMCMCVFVPMCECDQNSYVALYPWWSRHLDQHLFVVRFKEIFGVKVRRWPSSLSLQVSLHRQAQMCKVHAHTHMSYIQPNMYTCVQMSTHMYRCVQVCTHMYTLVIHAYTYSHMHTVAMETAYYCVTD